MIAFKQLHDLRIYYLYALKNYNVIFAGSKAFKSASCTGLEVKSRDIGISKLKQFRNAFSKQIKINVFNRFKIHLLAALFADLFHNGYVIVKVINGHNVGFSAHSGKFIRKLFTLIGITVAPDKIGTAIAWLIFFALCWTLNTYLQAILTGIYIFIVEHKRIAPIKWYKKLWFSITFPMFDLIGKLALIIALFTKVEWKPIPHNAAVNIDQLENNKK